MTNNSEERCENCGQAIGKLETPRVWESSVVCWECHKRLLAQKDEKESVDRAAAQAEYEKKARAEMREEVAASDVDYTRYANRAGAGVVGSDVGHASVKIKAPEYGFLNFIVSSYMAFGYICFIVGVVVLIGGFGFIIYNGEFNIESMGAVILAFFSCILGGITSCAIGQLLSCIRDMARNSWIIASQ